MLTPLAALVPLAPLVSCMVVDSIEGLHNSLQSDRAALSFGSFWRVACSWGTCSVIQYCRHPCTQAFSPPSRSAEDLPLPHLVLLSPRVSAHISHIARLNPWPRSRRRALGLIRVRIAEAAEATNNQASSRRLATSFAVHGTGSVSSLHGSFGGTTG